MDLFLFLQQFCLPQAWIRSFLFFVHRQHCQIKSVPFLRDCRGTKCQSFTDQTCVIRCVGHLAILHVAVVDYHVIRIVLVSSTNIVILFTLSANSQCCCCILKQASSFDFSSLECGVISHLDKHECRSDYDHCSPSHSIEILFIA